MTSASDDSDASDIDQDDAHDEDQADQAQSAGALSVLAGELRELSVLTLAGAPPEFVLRGLRTMPSPGWELQVDEVDEEVDARGRRVFVYLTEVPPAGIVPHVLADSEVRIPLGPLSPGRHLVAVHVRRGEGEHVLVQSLILEGHAG